MITSERATLCLNAGVERATFRLDVTMSVRPGETVAVLGPNGAGKSTLLRAVMGLTALSSGSIRLGDEVLDDPAADVFVPAERRPVGLVFQNHRLFPHLSARDNVAFALRARGVGRRDARGCADEWLARLGLGDLGAVRPARLSGGQAQRVALARALAAEPHVLLLDEPLAALDVRTRIDVRAELRRHLRRFPGPTVFVTHDALDAMVLADRIVVIEDGAVVQQGAPQEVARRPATHYAARLVGLNLYEGRRVDASVVHLGSGTPLHVTGPVEDGTAVGATVLVALRPSAIALHTTRPDHGSPRNLWRGVVVGLEMLTDRVRVEVAGDERVLVDITPDALADLGLGERDEVWLTFKATDLEVYPTGA